MVKYYIEFVLPYASKFLILLLLNLLLIRFSFVQMFSLPNTKRMQANIQMSIAVNPSAFGELVLTLLKMLTSTRNRVIKRAMRPKIQKLCDCPM